MPWNTTRKIGFRFSLLFFSLYIFFNPNGFIPYIDVLFDIYIRPFHTFIPWMGKHILHIPYPITTFTNGSGDTTYDYLILLLILVLAILGTASWSFLAKNKQTNYDKLYGWLITLIRFYVAFTMMNYGFAKVIKLQFPFPSLSTLSTPYGQTSPMRLAWTFFGFSEGYNYFTGAAEVIAGLLLLFRRTTRIGAILSLTVAANIMAINYSFDVCVKLLSTILTLMSVYLILKDRKKHIGFFLFNHPLQPDEKEPPRFRKKWQHLSFITVKYLLIAFVLFGDIYGSATYAKTGGDHAPKPPLYGIYDVQNFIRNKDTLAPLTTDTTRWRKFIVSGPGRSLIKLMNDSVRTFLIKPDTTARTMLLTNSTDTTKKFTLAYTRLGKDSLLLKGKWMADSVTITLKRLDEQKFLLTSRGFHFINEFPYNR